MRKRKGEKKGFGRVFISKGAYARSSVRGRKSCANHSAIDEGGRFKNPTQGGEGGNIKDRKTKTILQHRGEFVFKNRKKNLTTGMKKSGEKGLSGEANTSLPGNADNKSLPEKPHSRIGNEFRKN